MVPQALCDLKSNDKCHQLSRSAWLALSLCCPVALSSCRFVALSPCQVCVSNTCVAQKLAGLRGPIRICTLAQRHLKLFSRLTLWANTHDKQEPTGPRRRGHLWALWAGRVLPARWQQWQDEALKATENAFYEWNESLSKVWHDIWVSMWYIDEWVVRLSGG